MAHFVVHCLLVLCLMSVVKADCYNKPLRHDGNRPYCMTKGMPLERVEYGERKKTENCYDCSCGHSGLYCCGFGIKAGSNAHSVPVPPGCMLVMEGCDYYYVDVYTMAPC